MKIRHEDKEYEFIRGSDILNNGMFLEAWSQEEPQKLLMLAFKSDTNGKFNFTAYEEELPFSLVEEFIRIARTDLTSDLNE